MTIGLAKDRYRFRYDLGTFWSDVDAISNPFGVDFSTIFVRFGDLVASAAKKLEMRFVL